MFTYGAPAKQIIKTISAGSATLPASLIELSNVTIGFWHIITRKQGFLCFPFLTCIPVAFKYLIVLSSRNDTQWFRKGGIST